MSIVSAVSTVATTLGTLVGLSAGMAAFGWDFPPFPLTTEFKHLAQSVAQQQIWILEQQKATATNLLLQLELARSQLQSQGQPVPQYIDAGIYEKQVMLAQIEQQLAQARQAALQGY